MGYGYFVQAGVPPVSSWEQANLDAVMLRDNVKTYGIFEKEGSALGTALKQVTQLTLAGQLGSGYTGKTQVGKVCYNKRRSAESNIPCNTAADCPGTNEACVNSAY